MSTSRERIAAADAEADRIYKRDMEMIRRKRLERVASECDLYGHDYQVNDHAHWEGDRWDRHPTKVFCPRCGTSWKVER